MDDDDTLDFLRNRELSNPVYQHPGGAPIGEYLTTAQAAALMGITDAGVRQAIARGLLPARHFGRAWLILRSDAIAYQANKKRPGRQKKSPR